MKPDYSDVEAILDYHCDQREGVPVLTGYEKNHKAAFHETVRLIGRKYDICYSDIDYILKERYTKEEIAKFYSLLMPKQEEFLKDDILEFKEYLEELKGKDKDTLQIIQQ